jgi:hypothetical protein
MAAPDTTPEKKKLDSFRWKLLKRLYEALDVPPDPGKHVKIQGWSGGQPKEVEVADGRCLVVMTKAQARKSGLKTCNNDQDLCIWDPVTGQIVCTDDPD